MPAEAYQRHGEPGPGDVELLEMVESSEVPAQDAEGEHARERHKPHRDPEPGAQPVGGIQVPHDRLVWSRVVGHTFPLENRDVNLGMNGALGIRPEPPMGLYHEGVGRGGS